MSSLRPWLSSHKHYIISLVIQLAVAGFLIHEWDGFVFTTSATQFLHGITPYEVANQAPPYTFCGLMQQWYAYPPLPLLMFSATYAPVHFLFGGNLILGRIFIKLSFILGNLLCAYLVYKFVAGVSSKENASKAEKLVLYNPFLILIAAVWGMFDIWIVNFLLLALLSLRRDRLGVAGVCFGLGVLIKPITLIFAPVFLAYIWNRKGSIKKPATFAFLAASIFALISLPFLISCPQGFMSQVLGMHASRPPTSWSPLMLLNLGEGASTVHAANIPFLSPAAISAISFALLGTAILLVFLYFCLKREVREKELLASLFLLMLTFTLFSKVVSPQFFVIPMVLAIALIYTYRDYVFLRMKDIKRYLTFLVIPYVGAALFEGRHYLMFVPPDIATGLTGKTAAAWDAQIAANFPISPYLYYTLNQVFLYILIVPAGIMALLITYRAFKRIIPVVSQEFSAFMLRVRLAIRRRTMERATSVFLISLFVLLPVAAGAAGQHMTKEENIPPPPPLGDKIVGIYYHWWENSSHDPEMKVDDWVEAKLTPEEGYYGNTLRWGASIYMKEDIQQMRQAGIDLVILSFPDYDVDYFVFAQIAEEEGIYFVPMVECAGLTRDDALSRVDEALLEKDSQVFLKYDGKPVVFLRDCHYFTAAFKEKIEKKHGEVFWIISEPDETYPEGLDAIFIYSPTSSGWEVRVDFLRGYSAEHHTPLLIPTAPLINEEDVYNDTWLIALGSGREDYPDIVLIASWNDYYTPSSIEPTVTVEFGDLFLTLTEHWCALFHLS